MAEVTQPDKKKSLQQLELERRSQDLLRVYNPSNKDYVVEWDRRGGTKLFRIPANGEAVLVRYIAEKFIKEMYWKILNDEAMKAVLQENERRIKKGMAEMDKTMKSGEQMQFEQKYYQPTNEKARKIISLLYLGVEQEYGVDRIAVSEQEKEASSDFKGVLGDVQSEKDLKTSDSSTPKTVDEKDSGGNIPSTPDGKLNNERNVEEVYKCDYPGCEFETKTKIALLGHKRTHRKEANVTT